MAGARERRITPRKACVIPLRFRVMSNAVTVGVVGAASDSAAGLEPARVRQSPGRVGIQEGQTVNLSERGIYFTSPMKLSVGEPLEMFLTIPGELTGRSAEAVKCSAVVVHVDAHGNEALGVGAAIERFQTLAESHTWDN
jgi:hypothetical protein